MSANRFNLSLFVIGGVAVAVMLGTPAHAAFVQATFNDNTAGQLGGQAGGSGDWSSNWGVGGSTSIIRVGQNEGVGDLSADPATNFALYSGGTAQGGTPQGVSANTSTSTYWRHSGRSIDGGMNDTTWFSVLMKTTNDNSRPGVTFNRTGYSIGSPRFGLNPNDADNGGDPDNVGVFVAPGAGLPGVTFTGLNLDPENGDSVLIVGRIDLDVDVSGNDELRLWANPDVTSIGAPDYVSTSVGVADIFGSSVTEVGVYAFHISGNGIFDTGVVDLLTVSDSATAYQDVTGIPEPASLAISLLGALLILGRCRR